MEWEDKLKNGESYEGQKMSFAEYAEKWLEYMKKEITYGSYKDYACIVNSKILPFFSVYKVSKIKTPLVEKFYMTLKDSCANSTIRKIANVLNGMFRTAVRWQMIEINPCKDAKVPKNKDEILGHAKSSTTMDIYAHSFEEQTREAANRLDEFLTNRMQKLA